MQSTVHATVSAPIDTVWEVLADHEGLSKWAPGISATLTSAGSADRNGVGAVRRIKGPLPMPAIVENALTKVIAAGLLNGLVRAVKKAR